VIIDTSALVTGERLGQSAAQIFSRLGADYGEEEVGLSVIRIRRQEFLDDLVADIAILPLTAGIARLAGKISGQQALQGIVIPFEDLLIGVTALHHGFGVITANRT